MTTKDNVTPSILYKSNLWREDDIILFLLLFLILSHLLRYTLYTVHCTVYGSGFFSPLLRSHLSICRK